MRFPTRPRILRIGILFKLILVFTSILVIIYFTTSNIFDYQRGIVNISREVVKVRFEVLSISQAMVDSLLSMEENQKKYDVLRQDNYKEYFTSALKEYKRNLSSIQWFTYPGSDVWSKLQDDFQATMGNQVDPAEITKAHQPWVPQEKLNAWLSTISSAKQDNERFIESSMRELYAWSERSVRAGLIGLGVSMAVALFGSVYLTYSLFRPLRELRRGIRSFTVDGKLESVRVISRDELGELAQAFNEMTARLTEEEKMRTDFIDMLSHEIRTPLTSIRESVNLMREQVLGEVNDRQKRFLDIASSEMERISKLLSRLMQVSSMSSRFINLSFKPVDPVHLLHETVDKATPGAEAKKIAITAHSVPDVPSVMADTEHLRQALLNLIGNAVKFSPPGSTVKASLQLADGGNQLLFSVVDSGPGIPEGEQPLVFNKYYRGEQLKKSADGIGLGLSIAKNIVEAHGGKIWLSSRPGRGSTFFFTIPIARETE
ncbi:sensor histidine kinase [Fundidesulfovibrio terrae]|uniref:sensor histidine kinase n=1 Tax=Fundidesulfovibrio terrae TaxID=2922866 RepID=UPI001FB0025C|nr:HAMP domain-containing sensor histidine kinase [Fundidesulfovibrio terrae]